MIVSIGRNTNCDLKIPETEESVSRQHAQLIEDNGILYIEDLKSTNGTYVNNVRIVKDIINESMDIRLGKYELKVEDKSMLFTILRHKHNNYAPEFQNIISEFKNYEKKKASINKNPYGFIRRSAITLGVIGIISMIPNIDQIVRLMALTVISPAIFFFTDTSPEKKTEKLDLLKHEMEDILRCPKCKTSLLQHSSVYWEQKTVCPVKNCLAKWKES